MFNPNDYVLKKEFNKFMMLNNKLVLVNKYKRYLSTIDPFNFEEEDYYLSLIDQSYKLFGCSLYFP